ncbi:rac GTPase-activating protein 1-like [Rana temporaria]|uniref:rac GTPase-activating protein 1-like n=1 Tax=Rana temporaria TaxID=8407 RepID=UPI001AAD29AD|nr:rac GTPase-activating protein 1-like [Rana temporaria]
MLRSLDATNQPLRRLAGGPAGDMNRMGESQRKALQACIDRLLKLLDFNMAAEDDFVKVVQSFEASRRKWQQTDMELREKRELLLRCEIERSALQVKLKHARNQVDVEMKRRQRVETELQTMERQMQLIGELIQSDGQTAAPLSDSVLAFLGGPKTTTHGAGSRLSMVDETGGSFLSDISYDQTEDDLDMDELAGRPVKLKPRERRRSSLAPLIAPFVKKSRTSLTTAMVKNNIKEAVMLISDGGPIHATSGMEPVPRRRSRKSRPLSSVFDQSSALPQINEAEQELEPDVAPLSMQVPGQAHVFLSKTMILAEQCTVCGHKTRFGKMSLKCRNCRILIHPECRDYCPKLCPPASLPIQNTGLKKGQGLLADFAPATPPMVPNLVVHCVNEIEKRGLSERGLYRISGCDRQVKEVKQKLLYGKVKSHQLSKEDIHTVCSVLKDFLRSLLEPLLTFSLHVQFLEAADILNENDSKTEICQAVQDLPPANRDTLAFLILHLYRVMRSPECQMDKMNLARVLGPTIVGYSVPDPSPFIIMQDTPRQAKVMSLLLSLPSGFWNQFLSNNQENQNCDSVSLAQERLFRPLTSPELNSGLALPSKSRVPSPYLTASASKSELMKKPGRFFTSPNN